MGAEEGAADERPCLNMFESKEEVECTMLALKIFPNIDQVVEAEQEDPETDEEEYAPQVFPDRDGDATYSDLTVLGSGEQAAHMLSLLAQAAIKVTAVCLTTYAAGILTLLGTAAALSRTPLGPAQVSSSVRTLASAFNGLEEQEVGVHQVPDDKNNTRDELRSLSHADLVTASP